MSDCNLAELRCTFLFRDSKIVIACLVIYSFSQNMAIVIRKKNKRLNIKDWNHGDKNNTAAESSGFSLFSADAF